MASTAILGLSPLNKPDKNAEISGENTISTMKQCRSDKARFLCFYDICEKMTQNDVFDIGGSYSDDGPDLWFYFRTSSSPGHHYLINLFVCHRRTGNVRIKVQVEPSVMLELGSAENQYSSHAFKSIKPDERHFIKTLCISKENCQKFLNNECLYVSIMIEMNAESVLSYEILRSIKLDHSSGQLLNKEATDFTLFSESGKGYKLHSISLAAHSHVFRDLLKKSDIKAHHLNLSDTDMELLIEFLYTGSIQNISKLDALKMLNVAIAYDLTGLFLLTQFGIVRQINVDNAVDLAIISEKYNLKKLQTMVFTYIKNHPEVMQSSSWINLEDVHLLKKMFQFAQCTQ